ncbi:MAG TPA: hypothetical protein VL551_20050 [Actinospica sp.]|jgi:hypothetical protein|nr:hypothetical protein [Actinospica sp.]
MPYSEQECLHHLLQILPADVAAEARDAWSIGEQEGALTRIADSLAGRPAGVSELDRARLAALAEHWGTLEALSSMLHAIPSSNNEEDAPWESVEGTRRATQIETELGREIAEDHSLAGRVLTAWLAAARSDDVLVRVYAREPWGPGWPAVAYAIVHPTWSGTAEQRPWPTAQTFESVYDALNAFAHQCTA